MKLKTKPCCFQHKDRAILVRDLLETLDEQVEENIEEAWLVEAENRLASYRQGQTKTRSATEVFASIEARLK